MLRKNYLSDYESELLRGGANFISETASVISMELFPVVDAVELINTFIGAVQSCCCPRAYHY